MAKPDTRTVAELKQAVADAVALVQGMTPQQAQEAIERCEFGGPEQKFVKDTREGSDGHKR